MLFIKDINSIKITKIKSWAIYFKVDGKSYLLHEDSDCYERGLDLFEKTNDEKGNYKLNHISSCYGGMIDTCHIKKGETYKSINKYKFVLEMVLRKLVNTNDDAIRLLVKQREKIKKVHNLILKSEIESRGW